MTISHTWSIASIFLLVSVSHAETTYTKVVDSNTIRPDTGTAFGSSLLVHPSQAPQISNGNIAFEVMDGISRVPNGLFFSQNGVLQTIVNTQTTTPTDSDYKFSRINNFMIDNDKVVFSAQSVNSSNMQKSGVYLWSNGNISLIADSSSSLPGLDSVSYIGIASISGNRVAFESQSEHPIDPNSSSRQAVMNAYIYDGGSTSLAYSVSTVFDYASASALYPTISNNSLFVYSNTGLNTPGYYWDVKKIDNSGTQILVSINDLAPGTTAHFDNLIAPVEASNDMAVFKSSYSHYPGFGIFDPNNGSIQMIVNQDTIAPGGVLPFRSISEPSYDNGHIAFQGTTDTDYGSIFTNLSGDLTRVVGYGESIDGHTILDGSFSGVKGLSANKIVAWGGFTDGSSAIYVATIPEASSIVMTAFFVGIAIAYLYRRSARIGTDSRSDPAVVVNQASI